MYSWADSAPYGRKASLPSSDYELSYMKPAASKDSKDQPDIESRTLLDNVQTAYNPSYHSQPWQAPFGSHRAIPLPSLPPAIAGRGTFWNWTKPWKYVQLGSSNDGTNIGVSRHRGWRKAVILAAILAGTVLVINTIFTIVVMTRFGAQDGVGTIYRGNCDLVKRWNTAIHLLINVLGTALLGASSYTMQCLNSPTRSEVDIAHAQRKSLDVGLPSMRNFAYMKKWRFALWLGLSLSTVPLHLFWNSCILTTSGANLFSYVVANEGFLTGGTYQQPNLTTTKTYSYSNRTCQGAYYYTNNDIGALIRSIYAGYRAGNYTSLSAKDCFSAYVDGDGAARRNLIIITKPDATMNMGYCGFSSQRWNGSSVLALDYDVRMQIQWLTLTNNVSPSKYGIPPSTGYYGTSSKMLDTSEKLIRQQVSDNGTWYLGPYLVDRCLSETIGVSQCKLQFVSYILYAVIACNAIKVVCMYATARYLWNLDEPILATVGDAITSFVEKRDETTAGKCLMDYMALKQHAWHETQGAKLYDPVYKRKRTVRLIRATSKVRWGWTIAICCSYLIVGFVLWDLSFDLTNEDRATAMKAKFGGVSGDYLFGLRGTSGRALIVNIIIANSFQLALSTTYFLYNSLYTAQCAALEWASFARAKLQPLRVTWPRGLQRSTYWLQLPYTYAIPLTILLIAMHFLISQSIFLARLQYYDHTGKVQERLGFMDIGFSPPAILTACCVGAGMIIAQILNALRPLDNRIPLHGNKSAVMSAMCHPGRLDFVPQTPEDNVTKRPVMWGVVTKPVRGFDPYTNQPIPQMQLAGHCGFTDRIVELPEEGLQYK